MSDNLNSPDTSNVDKESCRDVNLKRKGFIRWEDYFMATAILAGKRSKDPVTQVGACIVSKDNIIVGVGYNGFPNGCSDDVLPWGKESDTHNALDSKVYYVCHAEMNAILNKNTADVKGCTIYVSLFPCNECAKMIIQSGIKHVVYNSDKKSKKETTIAAKKMFDASGIEYRQFTPETNPIVIDFFEKNQDDMNQFCPTPSRKKEVR